MRGRSHAGLFFAYLLLTFLLAEGAVFANNLILFLVFWEGLLLTLFGMIFIGGQSAYKTAIKAFTIVGITDFCMLLGIAITGHLAGTYEMSQIALPLTGVGSVAFILLMIGAMAKAGAMPFHSWIPDAAIDAPLPFMAILPAAIEKLLGIYFLARISLEIFKLNPASWLSPLLMIIGVITILLAVMMALVQKDYKRLLSYHAISQVGYMILGIGTAVPIGIVGGLFHMINHALYKSCLFLSGGSVEKQTGTTDLSKLGGLASKMPITFICFAIAAFAISGVPPFNGFFSKELIYDGALERGTIYYWGALLGSFFTAASFLKLGHAVYFGRRSAATANVKEASWFMLAPMIIIAGICILFGVYNVWPLEKLIQPILGAGALEGHHFAGWPTNPLLVLGTFVVLFLAILNHYYGAKKTGGGLGAVDHIHYAPVLRQAYYGAERHWFDPYEIGLIFAVGAARILNMFDRLIDWVYEGLTVGLAVLAGRIIGWAHSGNFSTYVVWALLGTVAAIFLGVKF